MQNKKQRSRGNKMDTQDYLIIGIIVLGLAIPVSLFVAGLGIQGGGYAFLISTAGFFLVLFVSLFLETDY